MADIRTSKIFISASASAFVSPFSDRPPVAFYSSIVIPRTVEPGDCLPCSLRGITRRSLKEFLDQTASEEKTNALLPPQISQTTPTIPDPPTP